MSENAKKRRLPDTGNPGRNHPERLASRVVTCALLLAAVVLLVACSASAQSSQVYYCPMHPQVQSERSGDCSICGMHLVTRKGGGEAPEAPREAKVIYACPMHPQVQSDKASDCTICGMHLVKKVATESAGSSAPSLAGLAPVALGESRRRELGITFGRVEKRDFGPRIRATAAIVPDETRVFRIVARADGYVDRLDTPYAGLRVKRGQPLLSIYSPSIQAAQQQFIGQTPTDGRRYPATTTKATASAEGDDRDDAFRSKLKYWGFGDAQVDRIQQSKKIENSLDVESPASGVVTDKSVVLGQRVAPGDLLFTVTDLSRVWAEVAVPEMDAPKIREGVCVELTLNALPGDAFQGRVKFFQPILDPQTHTMKVVVEVPNPRGDLKPGMLGTAEARGEVRGRLAIPEGAVLRAGQENYAFVEDGEKLVPHRIVLGAGGDGFFEVVSGVKEGERVATSATFLLDSESSMQAALLAVGGHE